MLALKRKPTTARRQVMPTGREVFFDPDDIIVSKTDLQGRITYANRTFLEVSGFAEAELIGQPHSIIRHPDMPRAVFRLLWDTLGDGGEFFAYLNNLAKNGDHYWVFAHVTPSFDSRRGITGYHSNRRVPDRSVLENTIIPLYDRLLTIERSRANRKEGMELSCLDLLDVAQSNGKSYDEFVLSL